MTAVIYILIHEEDDKLLLQPHVALARPTTNKNMFEEIRTVHHSWQNPPNTFWLKQQERKKPTIEQMGASLRFTDTTNTHSTVAFTNASNALQLHSPTHQMLYSCIHQRNKHSTVALTNAPLVAFVNSPNTLQLHSSTHHCIHQCTKHSTVAFTNVPNTLQLHSPMHQTLDCIY